MFFGLGGRVHDSQKPIIYNFGYTKVLKIIEENSRIIFETHHVGKSQNVGNIFVEFVFGKRWERANLEDPLSGIWINIYKTHEM